MLASQASAPPAKPTTLALAKKTAAGMAKVSDAPGLENKIRERAHQVYEGRGCEPGKAAGLVPGRARDIESFNPRSNDRGRLQGFFEEPFPGVGL